MGLSLEAHAAGWCLGFIFHLVSLSLRSFVRAQTPQSSPRGFDTHGQSSLISATLTLAGVQHLEKPILPALPELLSQP